MRRYNPRMGRSRDQATAEKKPAAGQIKVRATPPSNAQSASEIAIGLRPLQNKAEADAATRSNAPLTGTGVMAIQRTAGNRAACQLIKVQRLAHPDFPNEPAVMSDMELLKAYAQGQKRGRNKFFGAGAGKADWGLPQEDRDAIEKEMRKRGLSEKSGSPLAGAREFFPTRWGVAAEVAKPAIAGGATAAGYYGATELSTAPGALSYDGHHAISPHGGVAAEVLGPLLMADAAVGMIRGSSAKKEAEERGDLAGAKLGERKIKQQRWGFAGGATTTAAGGVKLGAALGSTAAGLAAAAGGLGVVGGALTAAQGSYKIAKAGKKLWDFSGIFPLTANGKKWKEYAKDREKRKAGINALKVAAGALGIAAGVLLITSNPVGWAVGIAAMVAAGTYAIGKAGSKIYDAASRRSAKKSAEKSAGPGNRFVEEGEQGSSVLDPLAKPQTAEQSQADPKRRKEIHTLADKVTQENSKNALYASEMIVALRQGDKKKLAMMYGWRDDLVKIGFPGNSQDEDYKLTREYLAQKRKLAFPDQDLQRHDATEILGVLDVKEDVALTESGQDLIQKKLSVAEAS